MSDVRAMALGGRLAATAILSFAASAAIAQVPASNEPGLALPGRTIAPPPVAPDAAGDAKGADGATASVALGEPFSSAASGIALRPPAGGKMIRKEVGGDEIVRWIDDVNKWRLVVNRVTLTDPIPLTTTAKPLAGQPGGNKPGGSPTTAPDAADEQPQAPGFAESVAGQMPNETPGQMVRLEYLPINGYDAAIVASRYREAGVRYLLQEAIIRRTDKHYYVVSYTTPLDPSKSDIQSDPLAQRALDAFQQVIDSVELIDQEAVKRDQDDRLIRTRSLFVNWTKDLVKKTLVDEQWLRLMRDGKDVGYSYVVEELANDLPRAGKAGANDKFDPAKALGARIGVRSRTLPDAKLQIDAESWMWSSFDRSQEAFSNVVVQRDPTATTRPAGDSRRGDPGVIDYSVERGTGIRRDRIVPKQVPNPNGFGKPQLIETKDNIYELQIFSTARRAALPPLDRQLPPFYLPQAFVHLLPRLVPLNQAKTYLFATYVSERREAMMRYVDVLPVTSVNLGGRVYSAVPVQERLGLEGSITTHYLDPATKRYLGSTNPDSKITIVATDADTIRRIWSDAKLSRPGDVDDAAATPEPAEQPARSAQPAGAAPAR